MQTTYLAGASLRSDGLIRQFEPHPVTPADVWRHYAVRGRGARRPTRDNGISSRQCDRLSPVVLCTFDAIVRRDLFHGYSNRTQ